MSSPPTSLRALPFPAQLSAIDVELEAGRSGGLLRELSSFRDYQPLAYALSSLSGTGQLAELAGELIPLLLGIPDTGLRRVLRALDEVAIPSSFVEALAEGAWTLPIERVAAVAMIDRWLKNTSPVLRHHTSSRGLEHCRTQLAAGKVDEILGSHFMRLPGAKLAEFSRIADEAGSGSAWHQKLQTFADQVLDVLECQPKSLSQANAEELLSRQVYTDPGHFLVELLQNADDAGARLWQVQVFDDRIEVEHDGVPFDALDVVGVLSIGQTTKSREKIGFFGVGFKSVYEICERPQLYSGVFNLEIADVSIPRPLRPLPDLAPGRTRLVLPLRQGRDESISPEELFQTLANLPAQVVLTLNSIRELDLRYGSERRHVRGRDEDRGRFCIEDGDLSKRYLVERGEAEYEGIRGTHRAQGTPVLIAVSLDEEGCPVPINDGPTNDAPTIYSYLPTHERSGLRVLVHAHFDLPVDRERLDLNSEWNQWALGCAGELFGRAVGRLIEECAAGVPGSSEALDAVMAVVSLPSELSHSAFEVIAAPLCALEFLPGADGQRTAAPSTLVNNDPRLLQALAGVPMQSGRRLLRRLGDREALVALLLGSLELELEAVVSTLAQDARTRTQGDPLDPPWLPHMALLGAALTDSGIALGGLHELPCLPDTASRAHAPKTLLRANTRLRDFLIPLHPMIHEDLEAPSCTEFLRALQVPEARIRDLVELCSEQEAARRLIDRVGAQALLEYLHEAPRGELEFLPFAQIVPNDRSELSAVGEVWLAGDSELGALVRAAATRPPLAELDTEKLLRPVLLGLGCRSMGLGEMLDMLDDGRLQFHGEQFGALHEAINRLARYIDPSLAQRLARTAIFPVRNGGLAPLLGPDATGIPYDEALTTLWPSRSWLAPSTAQLPYVRALGISVIGPQELAAQFLDDASVAPKRRSIFAYLAERPTALGAAMIERLASAELWPDVHGTLRPLDELRRAAELPSVAALYQIWPRAMTVEIDAGPGSALHLAEALGLAHRIVMPDLSTAIADLRQGQSQGSGPFRSTGGLNFDDPIVVDIVRHVLVDAAEVVPRTALRAVGEAPIFLCLDGERRRLGNVVDLGRQRAMRVPTHLVAAFSALGFATLEAGEANALRALLDALGLRPATLSDLVLSSASKDVSLVDESANQLRDALSSDVPSLSAMDESLRSELSALAIWPTDNGLVPASAALRVRALDKLLVDTSMDVATLLSDKGLPLLRPDSEAAADVLSPFVDFADPARLLAALIVDTAIIDAALTEQTSLLNSVEKVAHLAAVLAHRVDSPWSLPLSVNAGQELVSRPVLLASPEEHSFCQGLALYSDLAHETWADTVTAAGVTGLASLAPRRVLDALREVSGEIGPPANHPCLDTRETRGALYRWLLQHASEIADDDQSLGLLGKSAVVLSQQGTLRSPRDLLFDDALPDLGIDWNPSEEVPVELGNWLRHSYRPASKQLRPVVDHMVQAIDDAAEAGDSTRLGQVLEHMARLLRAGHSDGELEDLARRFKLRKRLRVETEDGRFEFARRLLAAEPLDADLVPRFAKTPPPSAARAYRTPQVLRLLRASGAEDELGIAALRSYLEGNDRLEGNDATVALACYLGGAANRQPSLRHDLKLRRVSWIPDQLGATHKADALYWPTQEVETLIGDHPHLYVHPELVLRVPELREWLPLRESCDAKLEDIAAHLAGQAAKGIPAAEEALLWLDAQLGDNRLENKAVARALGDIPMLVDDHGQMRRASELIVAGGRRLFGERRGNWSWGARLKHLAAALKISKRPAKDDVLAFLDQVHREFLAYPDQILADRELLNRLPRCLDKLVDIGGKGPRALPVAALQDGEVIMLILPSPTTTIALPGDSEDAELLLLLADGSDIIGWRRYLRAYGVGPDTVAAPEPLEVRAPRPAIDLRDSPKPTLTPSEREEEDGPGVITRLRNWFRSSEDDEQDEDRARDEEELARRRPGSAPPQPPRGQSHGANFGSSSGEGAPRSPDSSAVSFVDQRSWFRGDRSLTTQLASNAGWLADRMQVAEFGLAHAPGQLPIPHRYAPLAVFADFDKRRQRWMPMNPDPQWRTGGPPAGRLQLRGKLPSPEAIIPMPLYGRLIDHSSDSAVRVIEGRVATVLLSKRDPIVSLTIGLSASPNFSNAPAAEGNKEMLQTCVADRELPEEVHDLVASLEREESALRISQAVCSFVKKRYTYDPTYLEDPQMAAWLQERSAGRSNTHIAALHAGGDAQFLGRGVCYELNALVCELLRRAGVPAAVATGWTFDRGHIDEPDHLWAMALMQTPDGPRWLPVDASTTQRGRPLHAAHRPPGPWRADKRKARKLEQPEWDVQGQEHSTGDALPISDLLRVARYLERTMDRHLGTRGEILAASRELLSDPKKSAALADLLDDIAPDDSEKD